MPPRGSDRWDLATPCRGTHKMQLPTRSCARRNCAGAQRRVAGFRPARGRPLVAGAATPSLPPSAKAGPRTPVGTPRPESFHSGGPRASTPRSQPPRRAGSTPRQPASAPPPEGGLRRAVKALNSPRWLNSHPSHPPNHSTRPRYRHSLIGCRHSKPSQPIKLISACQKKCCRHPAPVPPWPKASRPVRALPRLTK